jgi:hypothetical protein
MLWAKMEGRSLLKVQMSNMAIHVLYSAMKVIRGHYSYVKALLIREAPSRLRRRSFHEIELTTSTQCAEKEM